MAGIPEGDINLASPSKALMNIKEVANGELAKHKPEDILGFVKTGNLPMIHGLIKYHKLDKAVILLTGHKEEFAWSKTEKTSMENWNPLLLAIAYKRIEIVHYFTKELKIALRHAGKKPGS